MMSRAVAMASSSLTSFASCILATFEIAQEQHEGTVSFTERKQTPALRFKPGERPLKKLYRAVQQALQSPLATACSHSVTPSVQRDFVDRCDVENFGDE